MNTNPVVPFEKLIKCTQCNLPMIKKNIYIQPDGNSICSHCYVDHEKKDCKLSNYLLFYTN